MVVASFSLVLDSFQTAFPAESHNLALEAQAQIIILLENNIFIFKCSLLRSRSCSNDAVSQKSAPQGHHPRRQRMITKTGGSGLSPWPARLITPLPLLADFGYSNEMFEKDTEVWRQRVDSYWNHLSPKVSSDTVRNVMDMKENLGSFAAALKDKNVWVMNVVPEDGPKTLKIVYD